MFLISVDFGGKGSYRGLLVIEFPGWAISMVGNYFPKLESAPSLALPYRSQVPWPGIDDTNFELSKVKYRLIIVVNKILPFVKKIFNFYKVLHISKY